MLKKIEKVLKNSEIILGRYRKSTEKYERFWKNVKKIKLLVKNFSRKWLAL